MIVIAKIYIGVYVCIGAVINYFGFEFEFGNSDILIQANTFENIYLQNGGRDTTR